MSQELKMMAGMAKIIPMEVLIEKLDDALVEYKQMLLIEETVDKEIEKDTKGKLEFACIMVTMNLTLENTSHEQMSDDLNRFDDAKNLMDRLNGDKLGEDGTK